MIRDLAKQAAHATGSLLTQGAKGAVAPISNAAKNIYENFKPSSMIMSLARSGFGSLPDALLGIGSNIKGAYSGIGGSSNINESSNEETKTVLEDSNSTLDAILKVLEESGNLLSDIRGSLFNEEAIRNKQLLRSSARSFKAAETKRELPTSSKSNINIKAGEGLRIGKALLAGAIGGLIDDLVKFIAGLGGLFILKSKLILPIITSIFKGVFLNIRNIFSRIGPFFRNSMRGLFSNMGNIFSKIGPFLRNSMRGLFSNMGNIFSKIGPFLRNSISGIFSNMGNIFSKIGPFFRNSIGVFFTKFVPNLINMLKLLPTRFGSIFIRIIPAALGSIFSLGNILRLFGKLNLIGLAVMTLGQGLFAGVQEYMESGDIGAAMMAALDAMIKGITFGLLDLDTIKNGFNAGINFLKDLIGDKLDPLMDLIKDITTNIGWLFDNIKNSFGNAGNWIADKVEWGKTLFRTKITDPIDRIFNSITDAFSNTVITLKNGIGAMLIDWGRGFEDKWFIPFNDKIAKSLIEQGNSLITSSPSQFNRDFKNSEIDISVPASQQRVFNRDFKNSERDISVPVTRAEVENLREIVNTVIKPLFELSPPANMNQANPSIFQLNNDNRVNQIPNFSLPPRQNSPVNTTPNNMSVWQRDGSILAN